MHDFSHLSFATRCYLLFCRFFSLQFFVRQTFVSAWERKSVSFIFILSSNNNDKKIQQKKNEFVTRYLSIWEHCR